MDKGSIRRILQRHFLRKFFENDLISPDIDRRDVLVLAAVCLAVPGLVITVLLLGSKYVIGIPTPALTSLAAVDDKFLYISASMIVMGLIATIEWNALSLDMRDTANLGPLPIPARAVGFAQLSALAIFMSLFAIALNAVPSVVFPLLTVAHFHVGIVALVRMITVHAGVTIMAGAYAFLTVLLIRELLRFALSASWFARVSALMQPALVVLLGSTLLLLPWIASNVGRKWMIDATGIPALPPIWFLGLYEAGTSGITFQIRTLPLRIPRYVASAESQARVAYDAMTPSFVPFGETALAMLLMTALVALALHRWNGRTLPPLAAPAARAREATRRTVLSFIVGAVVPHPVARAGFFFSIQTLIRSVRQRMSLAVAVAAAFAIGVVVLHDVPMRLVSGASIPLKLLALQPAVLAIVLAGVRRSMQTPTELRANWVVQIAWRGELRPFVAGVKRAVLLVVCCPTLIALSVPASFVLGVSAAFNHFVCGLLLAVAMLEISLMGCRKPPFTAAATTIGSLRTAAPIYAGVILVASYLFGWIERAALQTSTAILMLICALIGICLLLSFVDRYQRRRDVLIEFDELPEMPTQRLGLIEGL